MSIRIISHQKNIDIISYLKMLQFYKTAMQYNFISQSHEIVKNRSVVIRVDFNVPVINSIVQDASRIRESLPTIQLCSKASKIILISHFGRPKNQEAEFSLKQILECVEEYVDESIEFLSEYDKEAISNSKSRIILLENLRYHKGEEENDSNFAKTLAELGDIYINDAFAASHRSHASVAGVAQFCKVYAGLLLEKEIMAIESVVSGTSSKFAIVGGAKVSTKIDLIQNLSKVTKTIFLCGGMANTFLYAQGFEIGASLCEKDFKEKALLILEESKQNGCTIILPDVVITAKKLEKNTNIEVKSVDDIEKDDIILDLCPNQDLINTALSHDVILWNGPLGVFEVPPFNVGTESLARALCQGKSKIYVGGGDSVSAIASSGLKSSMAYVSTGGGAFLEAIEGKILPGIKAVMHS